MPKKVKLSPGDMVCVAWVDIQEGVNEPTEGAGLGSWETVAYWVGRVRSKGVPSIVIRYSRDPHENGKPDPQSGYLCIPRVCVRAIYRLKIADIIQESAS